MSSSGCDVSRPARVLMILVVTISRGHAAQIPSDRLPALAIPKMPRPPTIDGVIHPVEWREACAVSGVANQADNYLIPRPTTYYLSWDANHLYMACRTWVMPGYKPRVNGRMPRSASTFDDGLELHFRPLGKNVPTGRTESSYKFFVNCLGFDGEPIRVAVGQMFKNWLPNFRTAARLTDPGTGPNGGRWWELEFAASTQDFELTGPNRAGDTWRLMLGFNHMLNTWMQARIPNNTSYWDPSGYCLGTLVENAPSVQVTMEDLPGLCDGTAAVTIRAYNPTGQQAQLNVLAHCFELRKKIVEGKEAAEAVGLIERDQTLTVEPGQTAEYRLNERLPRDLDDLTGGVFYRVTEGNKELFRYYAYFKVGYPTEYMSYVPPESAFPLWATFNPVRCNLLIQADAYSLDNPDTAKALRFRLLEEAGAKPLAEGTIDKMVTYYFRQLVQLPPLTEGTYAVEATITTKDDKQLGPEKATFRKLDEARTFAEWWRKGLGSAERVISPFVAMARKKDIVTCWGRSYRLNALGLPSDITSQEGKVVASPTRIIVVANGKEEVVNLKAMPRFTETRDWRVAFEGRAKGGGLVFRSKGMVEQDGLTVIELTYAPAGNSPVPVEALRLEFPIPSDQAECLLCIGPGGNFSSRTTMLLPDKQGKLWSTLDTGRVGSGMTVGSFYPEVWIGNERRGLLWWGDNDKGWVPDDAVPAHEVVRLGDVVLLRNNVIGSRFTLHESRTLTFSYMASPFRPLVKGWRAAIMSEDGTFSGGPSWGYKYRKDPKTGQEVDGWNWLTPPSRDPEEWSTLWAEYKQKADEKILRELPFGPAGARRWMFVHTSLPLVGYGWKSPDTKVTDYFASDWGDGECYTDSNMDYYLYLIDRAIREGGLRTIYWDIFFPCLHTTIQNDVAYQLPDGRIQPGYTGFNTRRFLMRCYALMGDRGLTPGSQVSHATNAYLLVACPWMDAILDGEYHILKDESPMDWVDGYPVERMRAMSCPHNFGTAISWMHLIQIQDKARHDRTVRGLVDYTRLYDSWRGPNGQSYPQAALDWGLNDERTEYMPFWRNPFVTCEDKEVLVSMWRLPDRVLLAAFNNNGKQAKDAKLKIDLDGLNLVPKLPWQEFIGVRVLDNPQEPAHGKEPDPVLDFNNRLLTLPNLQPHTGRLIGIRKY